MYQEDEMRPCVDNCCSEKEAVFVKQGRRLAHAYVPWQSYEKAYGPREALTKGTLFPDLWGVYKIPK